MLLSSKVTIIWWGKLVWVGSTFLSSKKKKLTFNIHCELPVIYKPRRSPGQMYTSSSNSHFLEERGTHHYPDDNLNISCHLVFDPRIRVWPWLGLLLCVWPAPITQSISEVRTTKHLTCQEIENQNMYVCPMFPNADVAPASEKAPFEVEVYNIANEWLFSRSTAHPRPDPITISQLTMQNTHNLL